MACQQILIGEKYGKLTVIKEAPNMGKDKAHFCNCDCGRTKNYSVRDTDLRRGKKIQCPICGKEDQIKKVTKNLIGQTFGHLTVLEDTGEKGKNGNHIWLCECDCKEHRKRKVLGSLLTSLSITSCEYCSGYKKDCTNEIFGYLQAISPTDKRDTCGSIIWKCKCLRDGNIIETSITNLIRGDTISCGCIKSKGEAKIVSLLQENNIKFEREKTYLNLLSLKNKPLKFDFYIPDKNYLIEYDGNIHFKETGLRDLNEIQFYDNIKNQFCKENNIPLIRIPYEYYNELVLEDLLLETSKYKIF